jgi:hypothetical protein
LVAIAWPLHNEDGNTTNIGLVEVYRYIKESLSWEREGNFLFGKVRGDFFGSSLSLGAAGNGGYTEVYSLDSGSWNQLGGTVTNSQEQLGIFSVSLSNDGTAFVVGGISAAEGEAVVQAFNLFAGNWEERGNGIGGQTAIGETIYMVDLSGDGNTIVVSNYYTTDAKANTGLYLDVRAFVWSDDADDWEPLGQNMHAGHITEKSGYFVSLSEDGRRIAMGDPVAGCGEQGQAVAGHIHFFVFSDGEWIQFDYAVAISGNGDYVVAGAPYNRATGEERGRVVVIGAAY